MISTNQHLPLRESESGIENLNRRYGRQKIRDNQNWFEGLLDGLFWGLIVGFIITAILAAYLYH